MSKPLVGLIMGSQTDWSTMREAADVLSELNIAYEKKIVSAHRTPNRLWSYGESAESRGCLLYTSPSPRDLSTSRMPSSA